MSIEVEGHRIEWNDLDLGKCKLTHFGLNKLSSPFFAKRFPGVSLPVSEQEVTWLEAWDLGWAMFPTMPALNALATSPVAVCGARGCIIGCMKHLDATGASTNKFRVRPVFSEEQPWKLDEKPAHTFEEHRGFVWDPDREPSEEEQPEPRADEGWY